MPSFWLGVLLILALSIWLPIFPSSGYASPLASPGEFLRHLVLPALTLGAALAAATMRMTRATMLEVLRSDYVRTASARAWPSACRRAAPRALPNAQIPIITLIGIQIGQLLGGVVITETVFSWPGIGKLTVDAIFARDYPVVQGAVLLTATLFVLINFVTDVIYAPGRPAREVELSDVHGPGAAGRAAQHAGEARRRPALGRRPAARRSRRRNGARRSADRDA